MTENSLFNFNNSNTFCISLFNKQDRWSKMQTRFTYLKLNVTRWCASTPVDLSDIFCNNLNQLQKACAQSHVNIWKHIISHNLEYAFILEDDACFDKQWLTKLELLTKQIDITKGDWGAIFLNASEPLQNCFIWTTSIEQYLTGGYILSKKGATTLLNMYNGCYYSADWMTSRLQYYEKCYTYFPWLIIQEGNESIIGSNYDGDHKKVVKCLTYINYSLDNYL